MKHFLFFIFLLGINASSCQSVKWQEEVLLTPSLEFQQSFENIYGVSYEKALKKSSKIFDEFSDCKKAWRLRAWILEGFFPHNYVFKNKHTPLSLACLCDDLSLVQYLIEEKKHAPNQYIHKKNTPLIYAVQGNSVNVVRYLLEQGADKYLRNKEGKNSLVLSTETNFKEKRWRINIEIASMLIDKKSIKEVPDEHFSDIMVEAIVSNSFQLFDIAFNEVLNRNILWVFKDPSINRFAISSGEAEVYKKVIPLSDLNIEVHDWSVTGRVISDITGKYHFDGFDKIFSYEIEEKHLQPLKFLKEHGANINYWGSEPETIITSVMEAPSMIAYLVKIGYDINQKFPSGKTIMDYAIEALFTRKTFSLNGQAVPLQREVSKEITYELRYFELLLSLGAITSKKVGGAALKKLLIFDAIKKEHISLIRELINEGVSFEIKDSLGNTPRDYANKKIIILLDGIK